MVLSLFSVVIRLGVDRILLSVSPFNAFNIIPMSGMLPEPAPIVINPPAAPERKLLLARVPILSPVKPVVELPPMFPEFAENCRPNF